MTDINRWDELVQVVKLRSKDMSGEWQYWDGDNKEKSIFTEYVQVPLNGYQLANLLGMLKKAENTGDWFEELIRICVVAMEKAGIDQMCDNQGNSFYLEELRKGII